MSKPIAVLISDVHYDINTLPLADAAMRLAIAKANELEVPLVIAGDLHDTKANLRAECLLAMRATLSLCRINCFIVRGNHDSINEKSTKTALLSLETYEYGDRHDFHDDITRSTEVISNPDFTNKIAVNGMSLYFIPYQHDPIDFKNVLDKIDKGSTIIMHQGVHGSISGEYIQDKSAVPKDWLADYRVISGHYHTRQTIKTGRPRKGAVGSMDYIGNPYTLNYGEANDPEKGFQVLMSDGTLEFVPTNLRKHVVIQTSLDMGEVVAPCLGWNNDDLVKVKLSGTKEQLSKINKKEFGERLGVPESYKLELIPLATQDDTKQKKAVQDTNLDTIIEELTNTTSEQKERLKTLWRNLCE